MKNKRVEESSTLMEYVSSLVEASVEANMRELELLEDDDDGIFSDKPAKKGPAVAPTADAPAQQPQQAPEPNPYAAKQHPQENFEEPTIDMVVDKLNAIRSGRSFRDSSVKGAMEQYFEKLGKEERAAMLAFLKGISQIVTGEVEGQAATDPNDTPSPGVKMTSATPAKSGAPHGGKPVKNVTVARAKTAQGSGGAPAKSMEDTSAPAPLRPRTK